MKTAPTTLALGSAPRPGALRLDLIPTFLGITNADSPDPRGAHGSLEHSSTLPVRSTFENLAEQYFGGEEAPADLEALTDLLNDHMPDSCYSARVKR